MARCRVATGVIELSDGQVAYVVQEHHAPHNRYTYILFSSTGGRTWGLPVLIADTPERGFGEPDIAEVAPGELYCVLRCSRSAGVLRDRRTGYLHGCRSLDGRRTWSTPEQTAMYGHPGQLLVLDDGRLLCTYGRQEAPFGIRACLSEDGERTWQADREIVIRDDLPNFCCYYGQEPDGVTCVQGTYLELT